MVATLGIGGIISEGADYYDFLKGSKFDRIRDAYRKMTGGIIELIKELLIPLLLLRKCQSI